MPTDGTPTVPVADTTMDGGVIDAAAAIAAIPGFDDMIADPSPTDTRGARQQQGHPNPADLSRATNGQFRARDPRIEPATVVDVKTKGEMPDATQQADAAQGEGADEESQPAEEFFELPPETEGGEPRRIKADEVFSGYQEAQQLKARLAEMERGTLPPEVYDQQMMQLVETQSQTLQRMQLYAQMLQPTEPDMQLIDEASPRYNPGLYQRQMAMRQQQMEQIGRIQGDMAAINADREQRVSALTNLQRARGREALSKIWPEVVASDGKEAARVRSEVSDYYGRYGVTPEVMASITNPGFYAVLKDALAYRRGQKERETAIKVVRSKPKLVRGAARGSNPQQQAYQAGMQRLTQSHSVEDAAMALRGLI